MLTAVIFIATFAIVGVGRAPLLRIDRTGAAIVGAILMVVTGAIGVDDAVHAVDYRTLILLFGMMIIVAHLRLAGGLAALARAVTTHVTHPAALLGVTVATAGVLSALFVNDTVCLVFTPLVLEIAAARGHRPVPYLLALATASNIGSVALMTGNPQNMLIGSQSGASFGGFAAALAPVAAAGLAIDTAIIWLLFRRDFAESTLDTTRLAPVRVHRALLVKSVVVTCAVLAGFFAGYDMAVVAIAGAAALLVTRRVAPRKIYGAIDWDLLMLFVGLFVVIGAVEKAGIAARLFDLLRPLGIGTTAGLAATAAALSNLISNVPAVLLLGRLVPRLADPRHAWLTLAMASTLAGNLTILGSIANLIVVEGGRRRGVTITFGEYARVGVPLTLITLLLGTWWLS